MPTILRIGPYRFFFFSEESGEPIHVHVIREQTEAKFWIKNEVSVASNDGFAARIAENYATCRRE